MKAILLLCLMPCEVMSPSKIFLRIWFLPRYCYYISCYCVSIPSNSSAQYCFITSKNHNRIAGKWDCWVCQILQFTSKRQNSLVLKLRKLFQRWDSIQNSIKANLMHTNCRLQLSMEKRIKKNSGCWIFWFTRNKCNFH